MKNRKTNLIAILVLINTVAIAQNVPECKFYLNNETSPKKETLCNDLKSLKVQVPIPSTVSKYDKVEIQRVFTDPSDDINAGIYYYDYGTGYGEREKFPNSRLVWETWNNGIEDENIFSIYINEKNIFIGTFKGTVWMTDVENLK